MRVVAFAFVLALVACGPPGERQRLTGTFTYGFEHNALEAGQPRQEAWCLAEESVELLGVERPPRNDRVGINLTIDAQISAPGRYGHMGMCAREVRITRIVERGEQYCLSSPEACAWQVSLDARD
jgi:hypothetical protein